MPVSVSSALSTSFHILWVFLISTYVVQGIYAIIYSDFITNTLSLITPFIII